MNVKDKWENIQEFAGVRERVGAGEMWCEWGFRRAGAEAWTKICTSLSSLLFTVARLHAARNEKKCHTVNIIW